MLSVFHMWQLRFTAALGNICLRCEAREEEIDLDCRHVDIMKKRQIFSAALFTWLFFWIISANSRLSAVMWHFKPLGGFFGGLAFICEISRFLLKDCSSWVLKICFISVGVVLWSFKGPTFHMPLCQWPGAAFIKCYVETFLKVNLRHMLKRAYANKNCDL